MTNTLDLSNINRFEGDVSAWFCDFALTNKFGKKRIRGHVQYGLSYDSQKFGDTQAIPLFNVGVNWRIGGKVESSEVR